MLFKTSDKIKEYAQLINQVDMNAIKATLNFVEENHVKNVLGKELFTSLQDAYAAAASDSEIIPTSYVLLLEQCRKVIGPMLCYYYAPKADVSVGDSGVQRIETTSNKTAFQYQNTNYVQANLREGEACTESLIEFLETNASDYPQWTASEPYTKYRSLFIKTAKEFNELYSSQTPYRNFYAMRPKMVDVEENNIRDLLGDTLYEYMKEKDADAATVFSTSEKQLLMRIKKAIAYLTVAFSLPHLNVRIDQAGLSVIASASFSSSDKDNTRAGADAASVSAVIKSCFEGAEIWINNTIKFLTAHPVDFITWIGFYVPPPSTEPLITPNTDLVNVYGII